MTETFAESNNLVGPSLTGTVTDGQTISGISFQVKTGTGTISGTVLDANGNPVTYNSVNASATINGVTYSAGIQTDGSGNYSFPVINGSWTVSVSQPGFASQTVNVTGATQTANFVESIITMQPSDQTVGAGQNATFNVQVNAPGSVSFQWQLSTDHGSTWSNLSDNSTYAGSTSSAVLSVNNVSISMSGYQYRCVVTYNSTPTTSTAGALNVLTPFQQWQSSYFGGNAGNPSIAGPLADPDHDGIVNLIEYALGSNPLSPANVSRPSPVVALDPNDNQLHLTLTANLNPSATDVTGIAPFLINSFGFQLLRI